MQSIYNFKADVICLNILMFEQQSFHNAVFINIKGIRPTSTEKGLLII